MVRLAAVVEGGLADELNVNLAPGYRVVEHISRGCPLDVYDAWSEARRTRCVAKRLRPDCANDASARRRLLAEGRLLRRLSHPHLVAPTR